MLYVKRSQLNVKIPAQIDERFRLQGGFYASKREVWVPTAAAILMFLESTPERQAEFIRKVRETEINSGMAELLAELAKQQVEALRPTQPVSGANQETKEERAARLLREAKEKRRAEGRQRPAPPDEDQGDEPQKKRA